MCRCPAWLAHSASLASVRTQDHPYMYTYILATQKAWSPSRPRLACVIVLCGTPFPGSLHSSRWRSVAPPGAPLCMWPTITPVAQTSTGALRAGARTDACQCRYTQHYVPRNSVSTCTQPQEQHTPHYTSTVMQQRCTKCWCTVFVPFVLPPVTWCT